LAPAEDGLVLSVCDDGCGLSDEAESQSGRLGMKLVKSLVAQVQGDLVIRRGPGVTFEITMPLTDQVGSSAGTSATSPR